MKNINQTLKLLKNGLSAIVQVLKLIVSFVYYMLLYIILIKKIYYIFTFILS